MHTFELSVVPQKLAACPSEAHRTVGRQGPAWRQHARERLRAIFASHERIAPYLRDLLQIPPRASLVQCLVDQRAPSDHGAADDQRDRHRPGVHGEHVLDAERQQSSQRGNVWQRLPRN